MTTVPVVLEAGFEHPDDGSAVSGTIIDVPTGSSALVVAATPGDSYALRLGDGERLGSWFTLDHQADEGPDGTAAERGDSGSLSGEGPEPTQRALPPVLVNAASTTVEIVRLAGDGDDPVIAFLSAEAGPGDEGETDADRLPTVAGRRQLATGEPAVIPRTSWTDRGWAAGNDGCRTGPWYGDNIQALVVHHTVNGNNYRQDQVDDLLRAIHYAHVDVNGWCDIGYNFVVDRFGTVWEARSGGVDRPVIGGHAKGFNTSTVGVALLGQHQAGVSPTAARPTAASQQAITDLATWKLGLHGVDPHGTTWLKNRSSRGRQRLESGVWHLLPTVLGHRDLGVTSCPGSLTTSFVADLADRVVANGVEDVAYRLDGWVPYGHGPGFTIADDHGEVRAAGSAAVAGMGSDPDPDPPGSTGPAALPSPEAVAIATTPGARPASGYVLHRDGVLHPFGPVAAVADRPAGDRIAVDVAAAAGGGGWVAAADGTVFGFGGQADRPVASSDFGSAVIRADLNGQGVGYVMDATGRLRSVGSAPATRIRPSVVNAVDLAVRSGGDSGWVVTDSGVLHSFGDAPEAVITSPGGLPPGRKVRAVVSAANGLGGWVLTADGQLWPFGRQRLILPLATDSVGDDAVDVAFVGSVEADEFLAGDTARYFRAVGQLFLGRPATFDEVEYWDGLLTYEGDRKVVTLELARSENWAGGRLEVMYHDVLDRSPDPAGSRYWLAQVGGGLGLSEIGVYFYGSSEYVARSGSVPAYVERLYEQLLERRSDPDGLAYWVGELESGRARPEDLAAGFYLSPESRRQRVGDLYRAILGRDPDEAGSAFWVQRLGQVDDVVVAAELASSYEFYRQTLG